MSDTPRTSACRSHQESILLCEELERGLAAANSERDNWEAENNRNLANFEKAISVGEKLERERKSLRILIDKSCEATGLPMRSIDDLPERIAYLVKGLSEANAKIAELEEYAKHAELPSAATIDDGGPAFPVRMAYYSTGMTLRDWFAGMALQGLLASGHFTTPANEEECQAWMTRHQDKWDDETDEELEFPKIKFDFTEAAFRCADSMLEYGKGGA